LGVGILTMKTFDFTHPDFLRHQESVREWLIKHYHKAVSEDEYITAMRDLRKEDTGKRVRRNRCPSNLQHHYQMLNKKFGFFQEIKNNEE